MEWKMEVIFHSGYIFLAELVLENKTYQMLNQKFFFLPACWEWEMLQTVPPKVHPESFNWKVIVKVGME